MSISILIEKHGAGNDILIPIATESFFSDYWAKKAAGLGLDYLERMQPRYNLDFLELPNLIKDLETLRDNILRSENTEETDTVWILDRLRFIIDSLKSEASDASFKAHVG